MGSRNSTQNLTFENSWRTVNWSGRDPMLQTLREFPSNDCVSSLKILVVGPEGVGKSTFITSLKTVLQGRNTYLAGSGTGGSSATRKYNVYNVKKGTDGSFFPFVFGDTMGLNQDSNNKLTNDIISILQGHMQEGYTFNPQRELNTENPHYNKTPSLNDKVHCLVFVVAADSVNYITGQYSKKMKSVLEEASQLGIPRVVIMSKVDAACPLVKENLKMVYRSRIIKEKMEQYSATLGVPLNCIFPLKNYHEEIDNNAETDILILTAVTNVVNFANDFVNESEKPWRKITWSEIGKMLQTLREFPSNDSVNPLRILVVGPAGVGKSTFITSVNTSLQGRNTYLADSVTGGHSATRKYTVYNLSKGTDGSLFPFVFGDTMGLDEGTKVLTDDISCILQGHMQEGYTFHNERKLKPENNYYHKTPSLNDKVHCLVFVIAAVSVNQIDDETMNKMKRVRQQASELGIPQVVIMTKVDVACPLVKGNLKMVYSSRNIKEKMEMCNKILGVQMKYIFPVKNYHEEIDNNAETDFLILTAVTNVVNFANDFVERKVQK